MSYSGKSTYSSGAALPEIAEDVSDLVAINSPHETPLLDALGDPPRSAQSTVHEWLEDSLLPNNDDLVSFTTPTFVVSNPAFFRVGDLVRQDGSTEIMIVTAINTGTSSVTVTRGYGGTSQTTIDIAKPLLIIGNAALEGDDAAAARFLTRSRATNYTQIFSATVDVSGSELAVRSIGLSDELDYQKNQRTKELLRDLESTVINGVASLSAPQGSSSVRRTMRGIIPFVQSNRFSPGVGIPSGTTLTEEQLNTALRNIWSISNGSVDLIVCGGATKRAINSFAASSRKFTGEDENFKSLVNVYESDFGVCRVVMSRAMPSGTMLLLDSSRIDVLPLGGRSFAYKPLARTGDREGGLVVGEYTLELRNETAHGMISGLS